MSPEAERKRALQEAVDKAAGGYPDWFSLAEKWRDEGVSQMDIYLTFWVAFLALGDDQDSPTAEAFGDAMDDVVGGYRSRLFQTYLLPDEIFAERMRRGIG